MGGTRGGDPGALMGIRAHIYSYRCSDSVCQLQHYTCTRSHYFKWAFGGDISLWLTWAHTGPLRLNRGLVGKQYNRPLLMNMHVSLPLI